MKITKGGAAWVGVGAAVAALAGFLFNFVIARALGPAGTGVVLSFATWFTILLTIGKLGTDTAVMREGARGVAGATKVSVGRFVSWALVIVLPVALLASLVLWFAAPAAAHFLADDPAANTVAIVRLGAAMLPFAIVGFVVLAGLRGLGAIGPYVSVEQLLKPLLRVLIALGLVVFGVTSIVAFATAWVVPTLVGFLVTLIFVKRLSAQWGQGEKLTREQTGTGRRELWKFAWPRAINQSVDIVNASVGVVVLALVSTAVETGLFGTALRIVLAGQLAYHAIRLLVAPSIAHSFAKNDLSNTQRIYQSANSLMVTASWPIYLFAIGGAVMILGFFGPGFEPAAPVLQILAVVAMGLALLGNMQTVVLMSGASTAALIATLSGLVVNIGATLLLVHTWGALGAAIGWSIGALVEAALLSRVMRRIGIRPATRPTVLLAARVLLILGPATVLMLVSSNVLLDIAIFIVGSLIVALWCRSDAMRAWRDLTADRSRGGIDEPAIASA